MRFLAVIALVLVGCGRSRFETHDANGDGNGIADTAADDTTDTAMVTCTHTFCDDFGDNDLSDWTQDQTNNGTGGLAGGQYVATVGATDDSFFIARSLPAPTTSVTVSMRIGYATTDVSSNCELDLVTLRWDSGACTVPFGFYFVRDGTGPFSLQETNGNNLCTNNRDNPYTFLDNTGLHDVTLTVTLGAANVATAQVVIDNVPKPLITTVQPVPSAPLTLRLGAYGDRNLGATWTITYDDVVVDVQ